MSVFQNFASILLLVISSLITRVKEGVLSKMLPPILNQLAIIGFLPLLALQLPTYPLIYINCTLFLITSVLNSVFLTHSGKQILLEFLIIAIWIFLIFVYRGKRNLPNEIYAENGLTDPIHFLVTDNLSPVYTFHFFVMLGIFFFLIGIVAINLQFAEKMVSKLNSLRS